MNVMEIYHIESDQLYNTIMYYFGLENIQRVRKRVPGSNTVTVDKKRLHFVKLHIFLVFELKFLRASPACHHFDHSGKLPDYFLLPVSEVTPVNVTNCCLRHGVDPSIHEHIRYASSSHLI